MSDNRPLKVTLVLTKFRNSEVVTYEDRYGNKKRAVVIPLDDNDLHETANSCVNVSFFAAPIVKINCIDRQTHLLKQLYGKDFFESEIKGKVHSPIMGNVTPNTGIVKYCKDAKDHFQDYYYNYSTRYHLSKTSKKVVPNRKKQQI